MIDVERLRRETPGVETVTHLNNAGASLMPSPVIDSVIAYLEHEAHHGGYETREQLADQVDLAYDATGELLGVDPADISLADNATRAWDMAFYGMPWEEGDRVVTTTSEYASNLAAYLDVRERRGIELVVVPDMPSGEIDVEAMASVVDERVALIAINHMPTNGGLINPAIEVGAIAREHGVPFLLDACQTAGQMPLDVDEIGCTMISATSRKYLRGPRGVGFLWVDPAMSTRLRPPLVELENALVRPDAFELRSGGRRFETWEKNYAGIVGFGVAVRYALEIGIEGIWAEIQRLANRTRAHLADIPAIEIRDLGSHLGGIVTFEVGGVEPEDVKRRLATASINVSTTTASSAPIDMHSRGITEMVRASVHAYNTDDEVDRFASAIRRMV